MVNNIKNIKGIVLFHLIIGCGMLFCSPNTYAQQVPFYSQYSFSPFVLNPAAAGADGYTTIILSHRNQWLGIEGAPKAYSASVQTRVMKRSHIFNKSYVKRRNKGVFHSGRVGFGLTAYNYRAGQIDQTAAQLAYAYHIDLRNKAQLSMGLSLGFLKYNCDPNNLRLIDNVDDPILNSKISLNIPDVNFGIFYIDQKKYIGLSALQLLQASLNFGLYAGENLQINRQYYLVGGYNFNVNRQDILESSFYLKASEQLDVQLDVSLKYIYNKKFWIGLGFRTGMTFIGTTGVCINRFYFSYAYDYSPRGLLNYSYGSHEVMLALKLGDNVRRYRYLDRY
ncbi:MAG: type IX secretion system membrane protein PorP/SprF [Bacteroidales bacterium]|nr:type IX secretion system membrane protein PorP/SprF [Bacteroidales bacterium]